jgi:hypothetical protein
MSFNNYHNYCNLNFIVFIQNDNNYHNYQFLYYTKNKKREKVIMLNFILCCTEYQLPTSDIKHAFSYE